MGISISTSVDKQNSIKAHDVDSYDDYINLRTYSAYVESLAREQSSELISNGYDEHARIIISNILHYAQKTVCIFTTSLKSSIYEHMSVLKALDEFLSKPDTKIKIVFQDIKSACDDNCEQDGNILQNTNKRFIEICSNHPEKCQMVQSSKDDAKIIEHYIIMDECGYRFCPDKTTTSAVASFNQPDAAKELLKRFEALIKRSTPLSLPAKERRAEEYA